MRDLTIKFQFDFDGIVPMYVHKQLTMFEINIYTLISVGGKARYLRMISKTPENDTQLDILLMYSVSGRFGMAWSTIHIP